jgi:MFS-type transporter involved in bile tolerance (Atg22 family)
VSTVVVNAALLELASAAAGCPKGDASDAADTECTGTVYGQNPLSLISNIAVVAGLLSAFFMPFIGVILDFTPYRRFVGILVAIVFTLIQATQIAIGEKTWFAMAILQSFSGFCFTIMITTTLAYLPEICEQVGRLKHARYTARFTAKQFTLQALFLIILSIISFAFGISSDSTKTARLSQALNVGIITILFGIGCRIMPSRHATRELPMGLSRCQILLYGLRQNIRTAVSIHREYKKGLRWYLLATMFAQSSVGALTTVSVVYLSSEVGLNATDITLFFLVVLTGTIPGARLATLISKRVNPNTSWQFAMLSLFAVMVVGALTLGNIPNKYLSLIWGFCVGVVLGWFYPTENLFFSCILPKGSEAEISGFRVYCSALLSWLPPLIFSVLVEHGVDAKWGMTLMGSFLLIAALMLRFGAGSWEEILHESGRHDDLTEVEVALAADT